MTEQYKTTLQKQQDLLLDHVNAHARKLAEVQLRIDQNRVLFHDDQKVLFVLANIEEAL